MVNLRRTASLGPTQLGKRNRSGVGERGMERSSACSRKFARDNPLSGGAGECTIAVE
jgi:hypothetical protein